MPRWIYTRDGEPLPEPIEVGADFRNRQVSTGDLGKFQYDNMRATDGSDISSRTKLKNYLKATGTTLASDYKGEWARAAADRERASRGDFDREARREAVGRAMYQTQKGKRR